MKSSKPRRNSINSVFILIMGLLVSLPSNGQPGWVDFTEFYYYAILDDKGDPVQFKNNKSYTIIIDSLSFSGKTIPRDSIMRAIENRTNEFDNIIRINDFSYQTKQSGIPPEIRIVHKKDTMAFNQNTYGQYHRNRQAPDFHRTLKFIPGYYYFPGWTGEVYDHPPESRGQVKINNLSQSHFIVPESVYKRRGPLRFQEKRTVEIEMNQQVVENFLNSTLAMEHYTEPTSQSPSLKPYKRPRWESPFYPTNDADVYIGFVECTLDTGNQYISKRVFSEFDKSTNTITHWMPNPNIHRFYLGDIYFDVANGILYQTTGIRQSDDPKCKIGWDVDCPYTTKTYSSKDDGKTWIEDTRFQDNFDKFQFRKFEFLDEKFALAYTRKDAKHSKGYKYQRGTYYLLRNMRVVDSLQTPEDVHYNDNYSHYNFKRTGDTIYLGAWGFDKYDYSKPFVQPLLVKSATGWEFEIVEDSREAIQARAKKEDEKIRPYHNFKLKDNRKMVFKNGAGSLILSRDVAEDISHSGVKIIEKGEQIYLIDDYYTLVTFNGGSTWYIYPQPLNDRGRYAFLDIDEENEISFFDLSKMEKQRYRFRIE